MKLNVLLGHALSLFLAAGRRRPTEISAAALREREQPAALTRQATHSRKGILSPTVSEDNVEIVRRIWDAWERRDTDAVFALYDPAIVWETHGNPVFGGSLQDGIYQGYDGMRQFYREWVDSFDVWQAHAETFIDARDNVVVGYRASGRGRVSGIELSNRVFWLVYGIRNGLVIRIDLFAEKAQALEAAGIPE